MLKAMFNAKVWDQMFMNGYFTLWRNDFPHPSTWQWNLKPSCSARTCCLRLDPYNTNKINKLCRWIYTIDNWTIMLQPSSYTVKILYIKLYGKCIMMHNDFRETRHLNIIQRASKSVFTVYTDMALFYFNLPLVLEAISYDQIEV